MQLALNAIGHPERNSGLMSGRAARQSIFTSKVPQIWRHAYGTADQRASGQSVCSSVHLSLTISRQSPY
jgi:hypothetical protein